MKTLQVILALGILVLIHEFGHFFFAKLFGIRVDKFYLFFDVGGVKLFSTKSKWFTKLFPKAEQWETEYGIGWLPLGGYCKICGMIDESMDKEQLKNEPQPWEFRTKPAWQRLLVMAGGVLFNFILAIILYVAILGIWGQAYISNEGQKVYVSELAEELGFRDKDHIISFDQYKPENVNSLYIDFIQETPEQVTVLRDTDTVTFVIDQSRIKDVLKSPDMFELAIEFTIDTIPENSPNYAADIIRGDKFVAIEGSAIEFLQDASPILEANAGSKVDITLVRGEDTLNRELQVDSTGRLGVILGMPEPTIKKYNILTAIPAGFKVAFDKIDLYIQNLKLVFNPSTEAYKSVGSFISIGQMFPSEWSWNIFLNHTAFLSIMLGVMNLIPIPALDGGHIMFTLYEIITRRKPSDKFLEITQIIGMILIIGLMILAFGNDIFKLFR